MSGPPGGANTKDEAEIEAAFVGYAMSDEHKEPLKQAERKEKGDTVTITFKNIDIVDPKTKKISHYDEIKITAKNKNNLSSEQILFSSFGAEDFVSCKKTNKKGESSFIDSRNNKDKCDVIIKGLRAAVLRSDISNKKSEKRGRVTKNLFKWAEEKKGTDPSLVKNCSEALNLARNMALLEQEALAKKNQNQVDIKSLRKKHILITVAVAIGAAILIAGVVTACVFFPPLIPIIAVGLPVVAGVVAAIRELAAGNRVVPAAIYKGLFHAVKSFVKGIWDYNTCSKEKEENRKTAERLAEVTEVTDRLKEPEKIYTPISLEERLGVTKQQPADKLEGETKKLQGGSQNNPKVVSIETAEDLAETERKKLEM